MKVALWVVIGIAIAAAVYVGVSHTQTQKPQTQSMDTNLPTITPITHAAGIIAWGDTTIYTDPTGDAAAFSGKPPADLIVITDMHGDHFSTSTLEAVVGPNTALVVPQAVKDLLAADLAARAHVLKNGESTEKAGIKIEAIPMYNIPESPDARHIKGRGNGYVLEKNGIRVYIAGDTGATPEMKALKDIDIALVPMNPPFTMTVEEAAQGVLAFEPKAVYPYHYRTRDGLSDVNKFKKLVNAGDLSIDVILLDWYPNQ